MNIKSLTFMNTLTAFIVSYVRGNFGEIHFLLSIMIWCSAREPAKFWEPRCPLGGRWMCSSPHLDGNVWMSDSQMLKCPERQSALLAMLLPVGPLSSEMATRRPTFQTKGLLSLYPSSVFLQWVYASTTNIQYPIDLQRRITPQPRQDDTISHGYRYYSPVTPDSATQTQLHKHSSSSQQNPNIASTIKFDLDNP